MEVLLEQMQKESLSKIKYTIQLLEERKKERKGYFFLHDLEDFSDKIFKIINDYSNVEYPDIGNRLEVSFSCYCAVIDYCNSIIDFNVETGKSIYRETNRKNMFKNDVKNLFILLEKKSLCDVD
jgi:CRISPR/Cas system-associated protein Cas5 (RAMP superfamily)